VIRLRSANIADVAALARLGSESFIAAFGHLYALADLESFLAEYRTEARFAEKLAEPGTRIQLAEDDSGALLGYALIELGYGDRDRPEPKPARPVFLSQLYCAPEATGKGVGSQLMDWVIAEARGWNADEIQLSVWSENFGAQRFYQRYDFRWLADIDFWVGNHRDDEFLYGLSLRER
jgi:diamine N-acetyltransferase